ncbi:2639_t:CDS:2, partial [Gigaspora margarita]
NEDDIEKKFISPIIISPEKSQSSFKPRTFPSIDDSYEESRPFIHDDIYTLPESLGIQETNQTTEVAQSIRFQPTE